MFVTCYEVHWDNIFACSRAKPVVLKRVLEERASRKSIPWTGQVRRRELYRRSRVLQFFVHKQYDCGKFINVSNTTMPIRIMLCGCFIKRTEDSPNEHRETADLVVVKDYSLRECATKFVTLYEYCSKVKNHTKAARQPSSAH